MLADANFSIGDEVAMARGHVLLRWATAQLRTRPLRTNPQSPVGGSADASARMCSGISTRIFCGISTAQALMLLAWNALCSFQIRRATCYIGLAGNIATEIKEHISSNPAPITSSRINGIDVFDVEKEIVAYLYWTTYSLSLWAFIQMGNGHFSALLPTSLTSIFLPVTEASSVIIQLDLVSENFSTLQKQKAVIREMWPLAHISSVIAYIYALYPSDGDAFESPSTNYWQEAPLLALQRLQQVKPTRDISAVCREINRVLMESIHILNRQVTEASSRNLVLAVYHTLAIHFLFPVTLQGELDEGIPAETLERFCTSTQEILHIFASIADQPQDLYSVTPSLRYCFPDVFGLSLDTCARALSLIQAKRTAGGLLLDAPMLHAYEGRLEVLSGRLYEMSQHDFLNQRKSLRLIRRQLKASLRAFGNWTGSVSSAASSPEQMRGSGSTSTASMPRTPPLPPLSTAGAHSDHFSSQATTAAGESRPCLVPQMDPSTSIVSGTQGLSTPEIDLRKPQWSANDMFGLLDSSVLEGEEQQHVSMSDLVDVHGGWFPDVQGAAMDLDMAGQWDWPAMGLDAAASAGICSDMDSVLYYFDAQQLHHNK
ncbi:hypothetical protein ESCO_003548 [Escovopsis weberi]|uniref:Transcription factor domain-containing protein n=1 Tax=Escovopsis weberi TaxID=150374 RepID=A0A0M8N9X9_ESCWE|nr:hypothetical protein ESCO_003548 [Escovopsis weberi]